MKKIGKRFNFEIANMGSPSNQSWCGLEWGFMKFQQSGHSWRNNSDMGCDSLRIAEGWHRLWPFFIFESSVLIFGGECIWTIHKGRVFNRRRKNAQVHKMRMVSFFNLPSVCVGAFNQSKPCRSKTCLGHSGIQSQLESYGVIKFPGQKQGSEVWNLFTFETSFLVSILPWLQVPRVCRKLFRSWVRSKVGKRFFCEQWGGSICQHMQRLQNLRIVVESFWSQSFELTFCW